MKSIETFLNLIKAYDIITIYAHQAPDGDALGSQWALATWLKKHFPKKTIKVINEGNKSLNNLFPKADQVSNEEIKASLAIVVDTANLARVNDERALLARQMIKIDHHHSQDHYGDLEIVNTSAASNTQHLFNIFSACELEIDQEIATYLLIGLITDTMNFSTKNTDSETFAIASQLMKYQLNLVKINQEIRSLRPEVFNYETALRQKIKIEAKVAYIIVTRHEYQSFNLPAVVAKESVNVMNSLNDVEVWALFIEDEKVDGVYNASLRSNNIVINSIAEKYHGGGHKQAAGIRGLTLEKIQDLLTDLKQLTISN